MIEAIGWMCLAWGISIVVTATIKKLWPEYWNNKDPF